jgi:hypothetical protein
MVEVGLTNPRKAAVAKGRKPDKLMRDALILALSREAEDGEGAPTKRLNLIAARLVEKAEGGDLAAIKEVFDRVDGKPTQPEAAEDGAPELKPIRVVIVDPKNPEA